MPYNAKQEAITYYRSELMKIIHTMNQPERKEKQSAFRNLYEMFERLEEYCSLFRLNDLHKLTVFLITKIELLNGHVRIKPGDERLFMSGLRMLYNELTDYQDFGSKRRKARLTAPTKKSRTIFVYDQDELFVKWLQDQLVDSEYQLIDLSVKRINFEALEDNPDIFIINFAGKQEGEEWVTFIREHYSASLPIIALTTSDHHLEHIDILQYNITHIVKKPFEPSLLFAYMDHAIKQNRLDVNVSSMRTQDMKHQRNEIEALIKKEWMRFQRFQAMFSLIWIKVDGISRYDVLNQLKLSISQTIRPYDELYIWSPSSLMLLLPVTPLEGAVAVGNRIIEMVDSKELPYAKDVYWGAIQSENEYSSYEQLLERLEADVNPVTSVQRSIIIPRLDEGTRNEHNERIKVLLIDDDLVTSTILSNHLDEEKWELEVCSEGVDALDHTLQYLPDIILCESKLKDLDGYSFCLQVRQLPKLENTIFCFLTEQELKHYIIRAFHIGADDYFLKPFYIEELEVRLQRHLHVRSRV
ncbi:response regulator [Pseudalkalibacillus sp. SCS-8]|uniref:response regulator n=1 Tax=Pseudalkalibacillus nanhaiensis TaxID=3115291 RepID=UPI0032DBECD5